MTHQLDPNDPLASGRRMGKTWIDIAATKWLRFIHNYVVDAVLTHAERRHRRRCERAKVYRPFWPRR